MRCAWDELIGILPEKIRPEVSLYGKDILQELRLRLGRRPVMVCSNGNRILSNEMKEADLRFVVNAASRFSPWAAATASQGYITAKGGHRIGLCGQCVLMGNEIIGLKSITSLCIRVAREIPGIASEIAKLEGNILLIGPPGSGKTTMLRDLVRQISNHISTGICVVDERSELFSQDVDSGAATDVITGCSKADGTLMALRTMSPSVIAVDEITAEEDCEALLNAGWCGVRILATAHAGDMQDLMHRPVYRSIIDSKLFDSVVTLRQDKTYQIERMRVCT